MTIPSTTSLAYAPAPAIITLNSGGAVCKRGFSSTSGKHEELASQLGMSRAMSLRGPYFAAESEHALS